MRRPDFEALPKGAIVGSKRFRSASCEHWLYVLEGVPSGLIKVGSTYQPRQRFANIKGEWRFRRTDTDLVCRAIYSIGTMRRGMAVQYEYGLHGMLRRAFGLADSRSSPEWYDAPLSDVMAIVEPYIQQITDDTFLMGLA